MIAITIIIATYNAEKTLRRCLESIIPQLTDKCELILIDGNSKDGTKEIIKAFEDKISYTISEPDEGIYDAWNKGIRVAKGKWIAFIGADDFLLPNAINLYLDILSTTPNIDEYDYICAHNEYVDKKNRILKILGAEPKWSSMRRMMVAAHVASLHSKKNLFETIGYYDYENYHICADYELLMRKREKLKFLMLPFHIAVMNFGGMSFSLKAIKESYRIRACHHSLPIFMNELQYIYDWFAYKFFYIKKKWIKVS